MRRPEALVQCLKVAEKNPEEVRNKAARSERGRGREGGVLLHGQWSEVRPDVFNAWGKWSRPLEPKWLEPKWLEPKWLWRGGQGEGETGRGRDGEREGGRGGGGEEGMEEGREDGRERGRERVKGGCARVA